MVRGVQTLEMLLLLHVFALAALSFTVKAEYIEIDLMEEKDNENGDQIAEIINALRRQDVERAQLLGRFPDTEWIHPHFPSPHHKLEYTEQRNLLKDMKCGADLDKLAQSITQNWTLALFDSFGKPPSGILKGDAMWLGDFDQCNSFVSPVTELFTSPLKGQYCMMSLSFPNVSMSIKTAICVPNSCGTTELQGNIENMGKILKNITSLQPFLKYLSSVKFFCYPQSVSLSASAIGCIVLLAIVLGLVAVGTSYDVVQEFIINLRTDVEVISFEKRKHTTDLEISDTTTTNETINNSSEVIDKKKHVQIHSKKSTNRIGEILLCFSVLRNGKAIFDMSNKPGQMNCLHGIRFISMTWIILAHCYVFGIEQYANKTDLVKLLKTWTFQTVMDGSFAVDTYFVLSGFLVTYLFLKEKSRFTIWKLGPLYLHRFIRLTPVYMAVMFFNSSLFTFIGDGPYWVYAARQENTCTKYWWRNLLYINNLFTNIDMCFGHSWYLANDMQFFVISPIFLVWLKSTKKAKKWIGFVIIMGLLIASCVTTGMIVKVNNYTNMLASLEENLTGGFFDNMYDKPWTRIGPYLIGCLLGLAINVQLHRKFMNWPVALLGWSVAITISLLDLYGMFDKQITLITAIVYYALYRVAWGVCIAWVIFACQNGFGSFIDKFLSWKFWYPWSRLTYCAYLVHPMVMFYYFQSLRQPIHYSHAVLSVHFLAFTALSYALALIASLTLEAPVIKLEKLLRQGFSK